MPGHRIFSCSTWALSWGSWGLAPWMGIKPRPAALSVWSLIHCVTGEFPSVGFQWRCQDYLMGKEEFLQWHWMLLWTGVSVSWAWQWFTVRSVSLVIWIGILELPLMPFPVLSPEVSLCVPVYPYSTQAPGLQLATCPASLERVPLSPSGLLSRIHEDPHRGKSRSHLAHQEQSHVFPSQILGMPGSQYEKLSCSCCERPAITSLTFWVSQAWVNRCYSVHPAAERTH